jgi:hypothetical protein
MRFKGIKIIATVIKFKHLDLTAPRLVKFNRTDYFTGIIVTILE